MSQVISLERNDAKISVWNHPKILFLMRSKNKGMEVAGVGKIEDIFAKRGLTLSNHTGNNMAGIDGIIEFLKQDFNGLVFANLVDFDALYGHRNNPRGYADALEAFDRRLPDVINNLRQDDILFITADHGNDPTTPSTDHTRERVPVLVYGYSVPNNINLGTRSSFSDIAVTIGELLQVDWQGPGDSFAKLIIYS
jgi:phosphopentomutase